MAPTTDSSTTANDRAAGVIDHRDRIAPPTLRRDYMATNTPVVLHGMMRDWPALSRWSFEYFAEIADDRTHRVDVGNVMQEPTRLDTADLRGYLADLAAGTAPAGGTRYLANVDLFGTFPDLRADIDMSLIHDNKRHVVASGWFGPAGTFTGWHTDYADNVLAQIHGRKVVDLIPPGLGRGMYPSRKFDRGATLSSIGDGSQLTGFPLHRFLRHERVELAPGSMIFIPKGWWHRVRSVDPSISVSFLGFSWAEEFGLPRNLARARTALHLARVYGRDCTCHVRH
ncbi:cupin-like domain-containing protein [Pseudonocardia sp. McavD-2-B]|uniref:cupin-like domain-containing protein n=1 Tax=Pseudonocardia sp. McavD-2-B TaxID=2954499 RepID=UPI002096B3D7|nr:cupin-like domain-containing protein [Pseudonocardia sp. McavD-2-B]MCO7193209.1 cupin-like domain-containing protein [Pseudonocardia sp. McavD-2-B]